MRLRVLVLACALVLAGCSGFTTSGSTETVTPAPVPTDGLRYPPGVTDDGVVPSALASAHAGALSTDSYTLTSEQRAYDEDGDLERRTDHVRWVGANASTYRGHFQQNATEYRAGWSTTRVDYWANRSIVATRYENQRGEVTLLRWPAENSDLLTDLTDQQRLEGELAAVEMRVARREADGDVVLVGSSPRDSEQLVTPLFAREVENVSVRMRVRYDGTVVARRLSYDAVLSSDRVHIVREVRITDVGETTVERPDWVQNTTVSQRR
ncbi:hypothetical protein EGH21_12085 [Halomicroarcula sp. F13]|uniref:Uncharacterized protein n=1 Tax=Haloarcula rubra TaxID=2487747 RepID=A0AAW4PQ86_9EURY|nr:hypothetical protein [Halomicroarcula rubra]MBX0323768.1 hypothetical protein [Halomicroarcula rubra]